MCKCKASYCFAKRCLRKLTTPPFSGGVVSRFCVFGYTFVFSALPPSYRPSTPCFLFYRKSQAFLDKAARLYHAALAESKNAVRSENGGKKNSIVYLDNGASYVEASRQIISGNNRNKWISQIKYYFDELLSDSGELDIKTQEGDILTLTKKETKYKAWDSHKTVQGNRVPMDNSEFKVKMRAESHIDELAEASTRNGRKLTQDKKKHAFAINGFSYRTAYFHDFDGKYYKVTISVGHNGTKATVYNVAQIKEDTLPTANILAVNGSKAVGKYPLKHSISEIGENVNSSSKKSFSVSEIQGEKEDYGQGVILDTELFKGISPRNWGKTLRDYFYKNLAGKEFTAYDEDGRSEVIHLARKNDRVQKDGAVNNHRVADKLARYSGDNIRSLTTVHIPEAIEVSRYKSSSDDHSHQWLDSDGWEFRTVYLQDNAGTIYEAELNIAHGNDRLILYDITNIKQIDKKRKAPEGDVGSSGRINTAGDLAHYPDASGSIIADENENVNSSSKKSYFVSEADEFDESIMDTDVNAETLRELKQEAELERFVHGRSKRCGRMPGLLRRFSKNKKDDT